MFRSCTGPEPGRRSGSPCLDYYIKRCEAPCVGYVSKEDYRAAIDALAPADWARAARGHAERTAAIVATLSAATSTVAAAVRAARRRHHQRTP